MRSAGIALLAVADFFGVWGSPSTIRAQEPTAAHVDFFQKKVQPILEQHCWKCHGGKGTPKGGLRMTSRDGVLKGGDSGPAAEVARPAESLLVKAINYDGYEMPPTGKLPKDQIEILTEWVRIGLPMKPGQPIAEIPAEPKKGPPPVNEETRKFWSFQPVKRPAVPKSDSDWVRNPIDAFVLAKLQTEELMPSGPAEKTALLRRAFYDLIGLPPEPNDVAEFLADDSAQAFEKVVDRLLNSPHYGERWGRHWLDLVRYAESNSYERDDAKPFVWRYRDYVIRSFNADKPYDQFVREQLAGDELDPATPDGIIATGYYRLGIWDDEPADPAQALYDDLDDIVQTTGTTMLGLTIGCARCHDHKLDPIPQRDYYRFLSFFRNVRRYGDRSNDSVLKYSTRMVSLAEEREQQALEIRTYEDQLAALDRAIAEIDERVKRDLVGVENDEFKTPAARVEIVGKRVPKLLTQDEFRRYKNQTKERDKLAANKPTGLSTALCVTELGREPPATHVMIRGNPHVPGDVVEPGFLSVLTESKPALASLPAGIESSGRRLALANWIASRDNPLTARVLVNRIWQHHFGRGLVRSSSDFGFHGTPPTHPELLDWLAAEFLEGGWRIKRLHKLIMLSNTYQMSSRGNAQALTKDPENHWFWRCNMRRLSAEEVRDSLLAANGSLNRGKMFGPSIYVKIPAEVLAGQSRPGAGWGESSPEDQNRRSIYIHVKRSLAPPILASFDAADTDNSCPVRFATTQPTQALDMLNSEFLQDQSRVFANYLAVQAADSPREQVALALRRATQREASETEIQRGLRLLESLRSKHKLSVEESLRYFCLTAYNLNEFLYLD